MTQEMPILDSQSLVDCKSSIVKLEIMQQLKQWSIFERLRCGKFLKGFSLLLFASARKTLKENINPSIITEKEN